MRLIYLTFFILQQSFVFAQTNPKILVFWKMAEFKHESTSYGIEALKEIGAENRIDFVFSEDAGVFNGAELKQYDVVVFLNTTGNVLKREEEKAMIEFIRAGNGFVGIHSASDTEYNWPWYGDLVGAYFKNHPNVQKAKMEVVDNRHLSTMGFPSTWERRGEWYNFKEPLPKHIDVLIKVDEASYEGGSMQNNHPISWYHEYDGGRAFYTAMGHTIESFSEPLFRKHLLGAILWAAGQD